MVSINKFIFNYFYATFTFINKEFFLLVESESYSISSLVNKKLFCLYVTPLLKKFIVSSYYSNFYDLGFKFRF